MKTYIKEKNGKESFYKDGYTDLRGRFDYASLSSSELNNAEKFSILIMSDTLGNIYILLLKKVLLLRKSRLHHK